MLCPKCNNEAWLDHVEVIYNKTYYFYVCLNPNCSEYRKTSTPTGLSGETQIKEAQTSE